MTRSLSILLSTALAVAAPIALPATAQASEESHALIMAAIASPDRPAADKARDANRKPAALIEFAGIKPDDTVADIIPGGGYFTRIFSNLVGPQGKVYAVVPTEMLKGGMRAAAAAKAIAANPAFANVTEVETPSTDLAVPPLDVAWTSQNYHDIYNFWGPEAASKFDAAVFKALKPGGIFIVIDHVANPTTIEADLKPLHRIMPSIVKRQLLAAGFVFEGESKVLADPADTHDKPVFDPSIRGKTDQFVFKFRKPAK